MLCLSLSKYMQEWLSRRVDRLVTDVAVVTGLMNGDVAGACLRPPVYYGDSLISAPQLHAPRQLAAPIKPPLLSYLLTSNTYPLFPLHLLTRITLENNFCVYYRILQSFIFQVQNVFTLKTKLNHEIYLRKILEISLTLKTGF